MRSFSILPHAVSVLVVIVTGSLQMPSLAQNPVEVGKVSWGRDFDAALAASKASGKPVFLLFQEVPGCAGCKQFGRDVLGDPAVVKAIEENFTPLLIHNNKTGRDAEILKRFNEPAWNFQVVRFLDSNGRDLIPRKDRVWDATALTARMNAALEKAGQPEIAAARRTERVAGPEAVLGEGDALRTPGGGEMKLGGIDGVVRTEAGFLDGHEVTLVDYDPQTLPLESLTRMAKEAGVATKVYTRFNGYRRAPDSDQKRQLQGTKYDGLKLSHEQATKLNAFARTAPAKADAYLSNQPAR